MYVSFESGMEMFCDELSSLAGYRNGLEVNIESMKAL